MWLLLLSTVYFGVSLSLPDCESVAEQVGTSDEYHPLDSAVSPNCACPSPMVKEDKLCFPQGKEGLQCEWNTICEDDIGKPAHWLETHKLCLSSNYSRVMLATGKGKYCSIKPPTAEDRLCTKIATEAQDNMYQPLDGSGLCECPAKGKIVDKVCYPDTITEKNCEMDVICEDSLHKPALWQASISKCVSSDYKNLMKAVKGSGKYCTPKPAEKGAACTVIAKRSAENLYFEPVDGGAQCTCPSSVTPKDGICYPKGDTMEPCTWKDVCEDKSGQPALWKKEIMKCVSSDSKTVMKAVGTNKYCTKLPPEEPTDTSSGSTMSTATFVVIVVVPICFVLVAGGTIYLLLSTGPRRPDIEPEEPIPPAPVRPAAVVNRPVAPIRNPGQPSAPTTAAPPPMSPSALAGASAAVADARHSRARRLQPGDEELQTNEGWEEMDDEDIWNAEHQ